MAAESAANQGPGAVFARYRTDHSAPIRWHAACLFSSSMMNTAEINPPKKLIRSRKNRMFLGVCGGIAEYLNVDPTVVRVLYVLLSILTAVFPGILMYFLLALIMPNADE